MRKFILFLIVFLVVFGLNTADNTAESKSDEDVGQIFRMTETPDPIPVGDDHLGYDEFLASTWDTLLPTGYTPGDAYDPSAAIIPDVFVERESKWMSTPYGDNTDVYPIYRYTFTPVNGYKETVMLTSGCHGNEAEGYWGLYRLINMIYFEGDKYPTLGSLKNVRFIIIPSWNPWGFQHYRRFNAFEDGKLHPWNWLISTKHKKTVDGVVYDITDIGEANVIYETIHEYEGKLSLWVDLHTDPYAGRDTTNVNIDNPHAYTPPYGCYGYAAADSNTYRAMCYVMRAFYNICKSELNFAETWHPGKATPGSSSFTGWQASLGFPCALIEISTFMDNFPYPSGSGELMKLTQEYYGNCIFNMLRTKFPRSIKDAKVILSKAAFTYNGKVQKPTIKTIKGLALKSGTDYTTAWSNASSKSVGKYTVTIKGKGNYTGATKATYKINPKGTSLGTLKSAKKAATVKWNKQSAKMSTSRITGYQIQLATNKAFTKNKKTVIAKGYRVTSMKFIKLKGGKKYYVRVRTYKTVKDTRYYSPWSGVKTVTTK